MMEGACSAIGEDSVLYRVYPLVATTSDSLTDLAITYNTDLQRLSGDHIWYYETPRLIESNKGEVCCLVGEMCFRDCVDDEWFLVGTLLELTKLHPHLLVSVEDSDGQFLLIEGAHLLPKWAKPETTTNRVFLFQGAVHIVGYPATPSDVGVLPIGNATIRQSINSIRTNPLVTKASQDIQNTISMRIERSSNIPFHSAHCLIPIPAAHILANDRQLISSVVHAFCDRDKRDMKVIRQLENFSPKHNQLVITMVTFPRLLYAKLCHEQWNIPPMYSSAVTGHQYKTTLLGMKLTCGLEILSRYSGHTSPSHVGVATGDSGWSKFLSGLCERGYFKGEIEGSKLYRELLSNALHYYNTVVRNDNDKLSVLEEAGCVIAQLLAKKDWNEDDYTTPPSGPADDDSWLELTPEQLDSVMNAYTPHSHHDGKTHSNSTKPASSLEFEEVVYGMKSFVDRVSSVDGAEFPWSSEGGADISFDPNSFVSTLETLMDKLGQDSDDNDECSTDDDSSCCESADEDMLQVMEQLSNELSTFNNLKQDEPEGVATDEPVNVDYNVITNLLESYSGQGGGAGPASNILNTLGIEIPK